MNGRERILTALDGGEPDRVPCALGFFHVGCAAGPYAGIVDVDFVEVPPSPEDEALRARVEPFPPDTRLGSRIQIATYARWQYRPQDSELTWGSAPHPGSVARGAPRLRSSSYGEARRSLARFSGQAQAAVAPRRSLAGRAVRGLANPLARARTLDDLRRFPFPEPAVGRRAVADLDERVRTLHGRGLAVGGNLPHLGGELFETAWRLRGLENFLLDLVSRPEWAHCLLDRLAERARRHAETLARAGIDVLVLDDDVGMPGGMMIGPATWREFFKPRLAAIIRGARDAAPALRVLYHSDGNYAPIVGDFVEIGVDAINPLQPEYMDAVEIRRRYGARPALWGTVGRQTTFSWSTPAEIDREVKTRIDTSGRAGLVLSPAYDIDEPDVPPENIAAFLRAVQAYG